MLDDFGLPQPTIPKKLSHVTNWLCKEGIFAQMRWTHCNKDNNIQCCQHPALIRILPEDLLSEGEDFEGGIASTAKEDAYGNKEREDDFEHDPTLLARRNVASPG